MFHINNLNIFFKEINNQIIFTGNYMEVYLPRIYLDEGIVEFYGNKINTLGIFNFKIFSDEAKKDNVKMNTYSFSSIITMQPSSYNLEKMDLFDEIDDNSFLILKFYKNDIFIDSLDIAKASKNTEKFLKILNSGKLPKTIPYNKILELLLTNMRINGVNFEVPSSILELIISELYREKNNLELPFRFKAGSPKKVSMLDYDTINLKSISYYNSTFTSLTFEDFDYALLTSINKNNLKKEEKISPVEKVLKY